MLWNRCLCSRPACLLPTCVRRACRTCAVGRGDGLRRPCARGGERRRGSPGAQRVVGGRGHRGKHRAGQACDMPLVCRQQRLPEPTPGRQQRGPVRRVPAVGEVRSHGRRQQHSWEAAGGQAVLDLPERLQIFGPRVSVTAPKRASALPWSVGSRCLLGVGVGQQCCPRVSRKRG